MRENLRDVFVFQMNSVLAERSQQFRSSFSMELQTRIVHFSALIKAN